MEKKIDKGKKVSHPQPDLAGQKPYGNIGPGRTSAETRVVKKLKQKKASLLAKGSTIESGTMANLGKTSSVIRSFANRP